MRPVVGRQLAVASLVEEVAAGSAGERSNEKSDGSNDAEVRADEVSDQRAQHRKRVSADMKTYRGASVSRKDQTLHKLTVFEVMKPA